MGRLLVANLVKQGVKWAPKCRNLFLGSPLLWWNVDYSSRTLWSVHPLDMLPTILLNNLRLLTVRQLKVSSLSFLRRLLGLSLSSNLSSVVDTLKLPTRKRLTVDV